MTPEYNEHDELANLSALKKEMFQRALSSFVNVSAKAASASAYVDLQKAQNEFQKKQIFFPKSVADRDAYLNLEKLKEEMFNRTLFEPGFIRDDNARAAAASAYAKLLMAQIPLYDRAP